MQTTTQQQPLEWWQVIENATVRELAALRASGRISMGKVEQPADRDAELDRELAHHRGQSAKNPAS